MPIKILESLANSKCITLLGRKDFKNIVGGYGHILFMR
jgi:hypothetical protein